MSAAFAAYAAAAMAIYLASGLGHWSPQFSPLGRSLALVVGFFFLPSMAEELLWRWLLIPPSLTGRIDRRSVIAIAATTLLATAAHPFVAWAFVPHARAVFYRPEFLVIVSLLGVTSGTAYVVTRSIWPSVVIHWLTVLAWKFLLGGPFVLLGR